VNSVRAEIRRIRNINAARAAKRRAEQAVKNIAREKRRRNLAAAKIQALVRGFLTRKRQSTNNRFVYVMNPNGTYSMAIKPSKFNKLYKSRAALKNQELQLTRHLQSFM
jgi:hypothetical protein